MGSKKSFFGRGGNRKKRADRVVRPYGCGGRSEIVTMHCNCSQTLIRLLRRHLPRRGRQSAAAGIWADRGVRPYGCGGKSGVVLYP